MVHIFVTGASGFVGGDALYAVSAAHPDYSFSALVRSDASAKEISAKYPNLKIVRGDLDDVKAVEEEAAKSDVVLNLATSNHIGSVKAIVKGLESRENGGAVLQISGASILSYAELQAGTYGKPSSQVLDDVKDIDEITRLTSKHPVRVQDHYLLTLGSKKIKSAVVCAPCIYGIGRGPGHIKSQQIPDLTIAALKAGEGLIPGEGGSRWGTVHVANLSAIYAALVEKALSGATEGLWGKDGYYFPSTDEWSWKAMAEKIAKEAKEIGALKTENVRSASKEELDKLAGESALFGISARVIASRAPKYLEWTGKAWSVEEEIIRVVKEEAEAFK